MKYYTISPNPVGRRHHSCHRRPTCRRSHRFFLLSSWTTLPPSWSKHERNKTRFRATAHDHQRGLPAGYQKFPLMYTGWLVKVVHNGTYTGDWDVKCVRRDPYLVPSTRQKSRPLA